LAAAAADMTRVADQLARDSPSTYRGHGIVLEPLRNALIGGEVRLTATVLLGVVGFVLLMCCANVANLLLARTGARARELAVRSALGAGRRRIAGQLLTESLVLALLGGVLGVAVGAAILRIVPAVIPPGLLPNAVAVAFDARVATFCALATILVGLIFGLAPAWQATGASLVQVFAASGRTTGRGGRLRGLLVVGEVAAAVLVLSGAGLLLRTWLALDSVDPGARAHNVLTTTLGLPFPRPGGASRYATPESARQYYEAVAREVEGQPGVKRVALGGVMPLDGGWLSQPFEIAGDTPRPDGQKPLAPYHMVSSNYFEALAIPLVSGRAFTEEDSGGGPPVAIVSEAFVQQHLAGRPPIGMRIAVPMLTFGPARVVEREIVGVVRQVKAQPDEPMGQAHLYVPLAQNTWWSASLIVEPDSGQQAEALVSAVRGAVGRIDRDRTLAPMRTLEAIAWSATSRPRFRAVLVTAFAVVALTLALVGVFGVLAYSVQQRTREFGVRIALGASTPDVLRLVLGGAARLAIAGAAIGLALAVALTRFLGSLLFGVQPLDAMTFGGAAAVLGLAALAAAAAPALRASRVDPIVTFRND
jgi:putative ABC transport system permease protein